MTLDFYAKKQAHAERRSRGHEWERDEDGGVRLLAADLPDPHSGPRCLRCGYFYCASCYGGPQVPCRPALLHPEQKRRRMRLRALCAFWGGLLVGALALNMILALAGWNHGWMRLLPSVGGALLAETLRRLTRWPQG